MKRSSSFAILLFALSALAGYLLSKASWAGRAGISLFYRQYTFLKTWWQAGLLVFFVWMALFFLQGWASRKLPLTVSKWIHTGAIIIALTGLYFTYQDFQHNTAHRWLGLRFHLGGYLFWMGWIAVSVFYLAKSNSINVTAALHTRGDESFTRSKNEQI